MLYLTIQQMTEQSFSISQIAKELKISRTTVYKYLEMTLEESYEWANSLSSRKKRLDQHKEWLLAWLQEYPHLSAAQMQDWLLERFPDFIVAESTMRLYVNQLREEYQIEKKPRERTYEAIEEQPMGKQMQVDWGETRQKTKDKREVKLYCICFVLSHSRYKYVEWKDRPFTTRDTIRCHENAFQFFGGIPEEIVYDQDHLITVSENSGDIILTGEFQSYKEQRKFRMYLCRKADPETKGKIENVVKYVKGNFADSRVFTTIDNWNERCLEWLKRTGNFKVHSNTKKRPAEVFLLEKQHLKPVSHLTLFEDTNGSSITRTVNKDNTIHYKSNRYSVPLGTYRPKGLNKVSIEMHKDEDNRQHLVITRYPEGEVLAKHPVELTKGKLIKNRNHSRDRSKGIQAYKETVIRQFKNAELATTYIDEVLENYPRYKRDQLGILHKVTIDYAAFIDSALQKCLDEHLMSANDFSDVAKYLGTLSSEEQQIQVSKPVQSTSYNIRVDTRPISTYTKILEGAMS
ncbi:IS21 family transposase [Sporosarcina sp. E16_3]|uniref:IS21 family transposase n=1 Tax=Sporosarcina sp. E16_3 TaxID=2789293 RepID=UPI001A926D1B|nr:IS21 family transposase [Sporosarcina sp. E16_3]MBO0603620.1 IS21 family transposase [Sporosarcina sp. E16_3]